MKTTYSKIRFSLYKAYTNLERLLYKGYIKHSLTVFLSDVFIKKKRCYNGGNYCFYFILNNQFISTFNTFMTYQMPIYTNIDSFMR